MTENRTLDATKHHVDRAVSAGAAGWHIGVFLLWAAKRGLAASQHDAAAIEPDPARYLSVRCGDKLLTDDLTSVGAAFADAHYDAYLNELSDIADANDLDDVSALAAHPSAVDWALETLDELFADSTFGS